MDETVYCCNCIEAAEFKYCDELYCFSCLCRVLEKEILTTFKNDIIKLKDLD